MEERIIKIGTVTLHIPHRTEEQQRKFQKRLGSTMMEIWANKTPEQRQAMLDAYERSLKEQK